MSSLVIPVAESDHARGLRSAPVTLVEYGDYQCPFCGAAAGVIRELQRTLGKRLRVVFRNFPLTEIHEYAMLGAQAAEAAAAQGYFWEMHDTIYEHQADLGSTAVIQWAEELGLEIRTFEKDLENAALARRIEQDFTGGLSGVTATPTFFINGERYDDPADFDSLLVACESAATVRRP